MPLDAFWVEAVASGKAQCHPRAAAGGRGIAGTQTRLAGASQVLASGRVLGRSEASLTIPQQSQHFKKAGMVEPGSTEMPFASVRR